MPLTASKTAACTMAATRPIASGFVAGGTSAAWNIISFQWVTSSAHATATKVPANRASIIGESLLKVVIGLASFQREPPRVLILSEPESGVRRGNWQVPRAEQFAQHSNVPAKRLGQRKKTLALPPKEQFSLILGATRSFP